MIVLFQFCLFLKDQDSWNHNVTQNLAKSDAHSYSLFMTNFTIRQECGRVEGRIWEKFSKVSDWIFEKWLNSASIHVVPISSIMFWAGFELKYILIWMKVGCLTRLTHKISINLCENMDNQMAVVRNLFHIWDFKMLMGSSINGLQHGIKLLRKRFQYLSCQSPNVTQFSS